MDHQTSNSAGHKSWTDGTWSPAPGDHLTPTSELANPLAAEQAMQVHRLHHAACALTAKTPPRRNSRLRGNQTPQETLGLIRPPSANLTREESPSISSAQLWMCPHLALPGLTQSGPISDVGQSPVRAAWSGETRVASSATDTPSATTSKRQPSEFCGGETSKTAPPSRQICATALSTAESSPPNPDLLHAARWWPRARRRSNKTRNCSASSRVTRFVGIAVKGTDDIGPLCV